MGRGTFHYSRLLKATPNLASNTSRDRTSTAFPGNLCWCLSTTIINNFYIFNLNLPFFSLKLLAFVLSLHFLIRISFPSLLQAPFQYWKAAMGSPHTFSRPNNPNSLSLSSQKRCSNTLIIFIALLCIHCNWFLSFDDRNQS